MKIFDRNTENKYFWFQVHHGEEETSGVMPKNYCLQLTSFSRTVNTINLGMLNSIRLE